MKTVRRRRTKKNHYALCALRRLFVHMKTAVDLKRGYFLNKRLTPRSRKRSISAVSALFFLFIRFLRWPRRQRQIVISDQRITSHDEPRLISRIQTSLRMARRVAPL